MRKILLETTPISSTTYNEWEYPNNISRMMDYDEDEETKIMGFDDIFVTNIKFVEDDDGDNNEKSNEEEGEGGECSKSITSSIDEIKELILTKKLKHNASERDRRNKINCLYAVLRASLPSTFYPKSKKLSNATTVGLVLKYIPQIQKEVEDLISKKQELSSQESKLNRKVKKRNKFKNDEKQKPQNSSSLVVFVDELKEREVIIRISTNEKRSLPHEVILLLENKGFIIIHVSSLQLLGERTLYNIHTCMEESPSMEYECLDEELISLFDNYKHVN